MNQEASLYSPERLYTCAQAPHTALPARVRPAPLPRRVASSLSGLTCDSLRRRTRMSVIGIFTGHTSTQAPHRVEAKASG